MKTLPAKSVDCFICDLPYGQLTGGGGKEKQKRKEKNSDDVIAGCAWDVKIDLKEFWEQVERLMKDEHTPVLHFCNTKFGFELYNSNPKWFHYDLVWNKERGVSFLLANKMPMKSHEMVYVFSKKGPYYKRIDEKTDKAEWVRDRTSEKTPGSASKQYGVGRKEPTSAGGVGGNRCVLSVINQKSPSKSIHPTEKPRELYRWLLERYCPPNGTVLDPTAGSFNSIEVARDLGLKGIGIEKDKGFFDTAKARLTPAGASETVVLTPTEK
jgi:site-specific DNA-methyltransferase (adenine-specific)